MDVDLAVVRVFQLFVVDVLVLRVVASTSDVVMVVVVVDGCCISGGGDYVVVVVTTVVNSVESPGVFQQCLFNVEASYCWFPQRHLLTALIGNLLIVLLML